MRRTDLVIKIVSIILFLAFAMYLGVYLYNSVMYPFSTALAISHTIEEGAQVSGLVVRDETVIDAGYDLYELLVDEGKKVSSGQAIAVAYVSLKALEAAEEIHSLQTQIAYLESAAREAITPADVSRLMSEEITRLSYAVGKRDFSAIESASVEIKALIFNSSKTDSQARLAELNDRLSALLSTSGGDTLSLYASYSGIFSAVVDGYEDIGPKNLKDITPSSLNALLSDDREGGESSPGKLISGLKWYYVVSLPEKDAARLTEGGSALLRFSKNYKAEMSMTVESISAAENGERAVVFSSTRNLSSITAFRELDAEIVYSSVSGIQVPKEAIRLDGDGNPCVYIVSGLQAELKRVEIIYETVDYYLIRNDTSNESALREGAEIIVKATDLYEGKVIY